MSLKTKEEAKKDWDAAMLALRKAVLEATAIGCYALGPTQGPYRTMKDLGPMMKSKEFRDELEARFVQLDQVYEAPSLPDKLIAKAKGLR